MKRFKRGKIRSEELYLDVEKTPNITVLKNIRHIPLALTRSLFSIPQCFFLYLLLVPLWKDGFESGKTREGTQKSLCLQEGSSLQTAQPEGVLGKKQEFRLAEVKE